MKFAKGTSVELLLQVEDNSLRATIKAGQPGKGAGSILGLKVRSQRK